MMKIIDRYISKNFIKSFILALTAFTGIFVLSQLFRVVKYVSEGRFDTHDAILYILTMLPKIFIEVSPLAILLASMMTVSSMASNLEIISLKTSGISFRRIVLFPIIISGIISIMVFFVNDSFYPNMQKINRSIRNGEVYEKKVAPLTKINAFLHGDNKDYVYLMGKINRETGVAENVEIIDLNKEFSKPIRIITTHKAKYDFKNKYWVLEKAHIYYGEDKTETKKNFIDSKYNDEPDKFITVSVEPRTLSISGLKKAIKNMRSVGGDTRELLVELGNRYSFPMAGFIISFLGLALGGRYVRGTSAVSLGVCVVLGYAYYVVRASFEALALNGFLNPLISGWIPNILFLGVGIFLLYKAEY